MKSILSIVPFVAVAAALNDQCSLVTVTETVYASPSPYAPASATTLSVSTKENAYPASVSSEIKTPSSYPVYPVASTSCDRETVSVTTTNKVTVTIGAGYATSSAYTPAPSSVEKPAYTPAPSSAEEPAYTPAPSSVEEPVYSLFSSPYPAAPAPSAAVPEQSKPAAIPTYEEPAKPAPSKEPVAQEENTSTPEVSAQATSGKATFYGGNISGGTCSFTGYTLPSGMFGTAFSGSAWNSGANCGRCVNVKGPNGQTIKAMIVDQCPECEPSHLDLFQNGFEKIGTLSAGIIKISYDFVPCGITSPIVLKNKEGTSPYWFSMQVMNGNTGVSKLEVSTDGGKTWKATQRQPYNFFENSAGFGTQSVDVKVTSIDGKTVVTKGVSIQAGKLTTAGGNF
ncbi:RlpA-like double-psi beta-barrel-protein domain-containing protein-containing protein [Dendryphion nanum]|uniref:RlpA-like double-psi beta-barrel-protein domain-containing protein-containing protein n=1 Tax=Dendryphion nanum TaxID=256645 RepID=A0A9P9DND0_9PLEO|nr:RlpA-like double-psi beta-barrel-protein domain-containing protein-containing protein [Dendryphion nanum]